MSNFVPFLLGLMVFFGTSRSVDQVLADCENFWLNQYLDVLPTINNRPEFPDALTDGFQETHFGRSNGASGLALCHVMAWSDIRCRLDILFEEAFHLEEDSTESKEENYDNIRNFVLKLFDPDTEAVVNFGAWYPPLSFDSWDKPDEPWFNQAPIVRPFVDDYMTEDLVELRDRYESDILSLLDPENTDENISFWNEANEEDPDKLFEIRKQNSKSIKHLFLYTNGCPSNLRYGDGSSNSGIGEDFDPMGDTSGTITRKESELIEKYVISYEAEEIDGQYYLRSSTGIYQPDSEIMNHWYIKCLKNNVGCF